MQVARAQQHHILCHTRGARNAITGRRLKDEGVKPGVPDLFIPYYALFIEMKAPKGKLTEVQKEWHKKLDVCGYNVITCYSAEEAIKAVGAYLL